jgi:putative ABC transport system permease protein
MTLKDSFLLSYKTVRSNKLRTGITVAIIAFGIMALIGIITAIKAMNQSLKESFSSMGANTFTIRYKESNIRFGRGNSTKVTQRGKKEKTSQLNKYIRKEDAEFFKNNYSYPGAAATIYLRGSQSVECIYAEKKTNPTSIIWGGDENYLVVSGFTIEAGRNLNHLDVETGRNVCMLGSNIATKLFGEHTEKGIDRIIRVGGRPYRVIAILKPKGSSSFLKQDDYVVTSYNNSSRTINASSSYLVGILVNNLSDMEGAIGEAESVFRGIRKLQPKDANNFAIEKSDKAAETFISLLSTITGSAGVIGLITLIGAAIGLMNIMLVSVNERTREVGLIKALGGKKKNIRQQFIFESMIISLLGAAWGIVLGILLGNFFASFMNTGFIIPWDWVITGILICTVVGLLAGIYPALKASKLSPIVALRYE